LTREPVAQYQYRLHVLEGAVLIRLTFFADDVAVIRLSSGQLTDAQLDFTLYCTHEKVSDCFGRLYLRSVRGAWFWPREHPPESDEDCPHIEYVVLPESLDHVHETAETLPYYDHFDLILMVGRYAERLLYLADEGVLKRARHALDMLDKQKLTRLGEIELAVLPENIDGLLTLAPPSGTLEVLPSFRSEKVLRRNVSVWRPPVSEDVPPLPTGVVYMHDGQNLFNPKTAFIGIDWGVGKTMSRLVSEQIVPPAMVVGVWNTAERLAEYFPQRAFDTVTDETLREQLVQKYGEPAGDSYLDFLVEELKPFVDRRYPVLKGPRYTHVMGSSMGGLISLYALCRYPDVFGAAACLSTHFPHQIDFFLDWLRENLPLNRRLYFDYGTTGGDEGIEARQMRVNEVLAEKGYVEGENLVVRRFEGADHSERAWRARVHMPLRFLLAGEIPP